MLSAIDFNDQLHLIAEEVRHITGDRHLSPELQTFKLPIAEMQPELEFGIRLIAA